MLVVGCLEQHLEQSVLCHVDLRLVNYEGLQKFIFGNAYYVRKCSTVSKKAALKNVDGALDS